MQGFVRTTLVIASILSLALPSTAKADDMKDFMMSCSYGVLAGTLVGAASLAFSDKPGDKMHRIARGASIGLYAGILLGWYVTSLDSEEEADGEGYANIKAPSLQVYPLLSDRGVEGGAFQYSVLRF